MIVEIKLRLQYKPENLDVNKFCFSEKLDIPNTRKESRFEAVEYLNL